MEVKESKKIFKRDCSIGIPLANTICFTYNYSWGMEDLDGDPGQEEFHPRSTSEKLFKNVKPPFLKMKDHQAAHALHWLK